MKNVIFKPKLESERLILQVPELTFENAQMLFETTNKNREHLEPWLPWISKVTEPCHSFVFLQNVIKSYLENKKAEYFIYEKSTGDFCGICSANMHDTLTQKYISFGYWLDKDKCKKGYMQETVKTIENNLFSQNVPKLVIRNDTGNFGSVNVAKKLNYHMDGILRSEYYSEKLKSYRDMYIWSKLHPDIEKQRG